MIQPLRHESAIPSLPDGIGDLSSRTHLATRVPLLVHVETVLGWHRGNLRRHGSVALTGNIHLPELRAEISFFTTGNGHAEEHRATATIVPPGFAMTIPLQYLPSPQPEESDVWALTPSPDRMPPWQEHYAGQLNGHPLTFDRHIPIDVTLDLHFTPDECQSGRGAQVDVAGELRFEDSIHMRVLFRDPEQSTAPPSIDSDEAILIVAGSRIPIMRQTVSSLAGRASWMSVRVREPGGSVLLDEPSLGQASWRS